MHSGMLSLLNQFWPPSDFGDVVRPAGVMVVEAGKALPRLS
jgi:hypothetical protein